MRSRSAAFDWDATIEGLKVTGSHAFEIKLARPFPQLLFILAMGYTAVVPRECAEHYKNDFGNRAIGTGPFKLREWVRGSHLIYDKNPHYRDERYPSEATDEFKARGLLKPAGKRIPFLDGIVFIPYEQDQPRWLKFRVGDLDMAQVPAEFHDAVYTKQSKLRQSFQDDGVSYYNLPLLDFIYRGFNVEHPVTGRGERGKKVRQAISLAMDTAEISDAFYNNTVIRYDGPIPPGLAGYEPGVTSPYRGPDLKKAKQLLKEAGYPNGKGLPTIEYHVNRGSSTVEQAEMVTRQLKRIGIQVDVQATSFPELQDKMKNKKAQMFSLAWGADYPDAENFLQLFYGPNKTPGSNKFNYDNPEYNRLYQQIRTMPPSDERTAIYKKMRAILIEDSVALGSMARTRFYVWNKRVKHAMPSETGQNWYKYLDVEPRE